MKRDYFLKISLIVVVFSFFAQTIAYSAIIRVKPTGDDANTGANWTSAKKTVQASINAAGAGDEIWVAAGTYPEHIKNKTTGPSGSEVAVDMGLYGGFAGTETARDQRNWNVNITILDGGGGDIPPAPLTGSVVTISAGADRTTRVDGFYITGGHAALGGGFLIIGSAPTIANNTIRYNYADSGAGIDIVDYKIIGVSPPNVLTALVINNLILDNYGRYAAAGINVLGSEDISRAGLPSNAPEIRGNLITRNFANYSGGGIANVGHSSAIIANNWIAANSASYTEAFALGSGGGILATKNDIGGTPIAYALNAPIIINNVIAANGAMHGGGIAILDADIVFATITNNTIVANNGAGVYWANTSPHIANNLVAFNTWGLEVSTLFPSTPTIRYNCVYGNTFWRSKSDYKGISNQTGLNGNISVNPFMVNYRIGNFHLQAGSPCTDSGAADAVGVGWTDIDGQARVIGNGVDIGADESDGHTWNATTPVIHVDPGGNDSQDGLSWATAKKTITAGIAAALNISTAGITGGEVWVAAGTYHEHIKIPAFVYLYGGFAGTETSRANRNISANPTILDGIDAQTFKATPKVVTFDMAGYLVSAVDGFTIQNGGKYSDGAIPQLADLNQERGGGIYVLVSSPYIANNLIRRNSVGNPFAVATIAEKGGGIFSLLTYAEITNNQFVQNEVLNTSDGGGGGIYFTFSMPYIEGNTFTNNQAKSGPAIYGYASAPRIAHNRIENNAFYNLMPLYFGSAEGAITLIQGDDLLVEANLIKGNTAAVGAGINVQTNKAGKIQDNLIINNTAYDPSSYGGMGGGIYCSVPLAGSFQIINNTIVGNTATNSLLSIEQGGGMAIAVLAAIAPPPPSGQMSIANNIIAFNSSGIFTTPTGVVPPILTKNDVYNTGSNYINLSAGATDIHLDPLFVDRSAGNFHLQAHSLCIDAGDNSSVPSSLTADFDGHPRIFHGKADMGALEFYRPTLVDFDGDGKTDIAFYRSTTGLWCVLPSSGSAYYGFGWGGPAFTPVPGDYDGDGKTDAAIYEASTGIWWVVPSSGAAAYGFGWGGPAFKPVAGDYDGDGKTDIAIYDTTGGAWWIIPSSGIPAYGVGWGGSAFKPVPGDYDGDGKTDIAIYDTAGGAWWIIPSSGIGPQGQVGAYGIGWGGSAFKPVPGDYDGDGKTDISIYNTANGGWWIIPSSGVGPQGQVGAYGVGWGGTGFTPVPGDYDGDGKTDVAIYQNSNYVWWRIYSSDGSTHGTGWGGEASEVPLTTNPN